MQMAIFGKEPTKACEWRIRVYLIDDSVQGNTFTPDLEDAEMKFLTTLSSLFVSNSEQDISIEVSAVASGWHISGENMK
ncbi:unnamed protein product, partial [Pocillopora meandrina]